MSHAVVRREHVCHQTREAFLVGALDRRLDKLASKALSLMRVFDDESEFRVSLREPLPASYAVNPPGIVRIGDNECAARMIIHAAEVMRLGGTKLWLRRCEPKVVSFLTALVVELDQLGFVRGR